MKKREIDGILERLRVIAETHIDKEMCERLGISYGTLDNWKARDSIPLKRLQKIAQDKDVSFEWLRSGIGELRSPSCVEEQNIPYGRKVEYTSLPYFPNTHASAGGGAYPYLDESEPISVTRDFLETHLGLRRSAGIFIINVTGESMEPALHDGSLIFINPIENEQGNIRDGAVYLLICDDMMLVKRVRVNPIDQTYTLVSEHPSYEDIVISSPSMNGCRFVGRVVGSFDRV